MTNTSNMTDAAAVDAAITANSANIANIVKIWDLFDAWRELGCKRLANGTELIGLQEGNQSSWLHVIFAGLSLDAVDRIAHDLGCAVPKDLRAFYRRYNGMQLFGGAFRVFGWRERAVYEGDAALQPEDIVFANHELDALGWKPPGAVAFAQNAWDMSLHLIGMPDDPVGVMRCDRATGAVLEHHSSLFECLSSRLYRLDDLMLQ